jgi:orotate phosphoribosyltransferase
LSLAQTALDSGAIRFDPARPFTWASGYRMPVYNDNRLLLGRASARREVAEGFAALLKAEGGFDLVAGTATAGIPHATTLADLLGLPLVYVRDKPKGHGLGNQIEGVRPEEGLKGKKVVLIEDLISTGGSSLKAVEALRAAGGDCRLCLSIMTYGFEEARRAFASLTPPCRALSLLDFSSLLPAAIAQGRLKAEDTQALEAWRQDPFGWGEKHGFPRAAS